MKINAKDVLIVIDVQNDFCPGGALAVPGGATIIPVIHRIAQKFEHIILTQDWHPAGHRSFASAHPGKQPFDSIDLGGGSETLWPDHCVQGSQGAALHCSLELPRAELIVRKGTREHIDSYSAFFENDRTTPTGLGGYMRERGFDRAFLAGLAYDFCVGYSALDARRIGLDAVVVVDACRPIDHGGSLAEIEAAFDRSGFSRVTSEMLLEEEEASGSEAL